MSDEPELKIDDQPEELQEWVRDQDLEGRDKVLHNFHRWMRNHSSLGSGSRVEYRKKLHGLMDEDGSLDVDKDQLETREKTAYNKFQEYRDDVDSPVSCDSEGDSGE